MTTRPHLRLVPPVRQPVDPTYFSGTGFQIEAKPGCVELTFEKPHNRMSMKQVCELIEMLDQANFTAGLLAEDELGV